MQDGSHRVGDKDGYGEGEGGEGEMGSTACGKRKASSHIEHLMHASVQRPDATNPLIQGANRGRQELGCGDFPSNGAVHGLFIHSSQDGSRSGAMGVACRVRVYRLRNGPPARLIAAGGGRIPPMAIPHHPTPLACLPLAEWRAPPPSRPPKPSAARAPPPAPAGPRCPWRTPCRRGFCRGGCRLPHWWPSGAGHP